MHSSASLLPPFGCESGWRFSRFRRSRKLKKPNTHTLVVGIIRVRFALKSVYRRAVVRDERPELLVGPPLIIEVAEVDAHPVERRPIEIGHDHVVVPLTGDGHAHRVSADARVVVRDFPLNLHHELGRTGNPVLLLEDLRQVPTQKLRMQWPRKPATGDHETRSVAR